jgi:pyrroline-5-carboxylate reductase
MNIVIVGAGNVGRALGGGWLKTGHKVTMAVREPTECTVSLLGTKVYKPQSRHRNEGDLDCFRHARIAEIHA